MLKSLNRDLVIKALVLILALTYAFSQLAYFRVVISIVTVLLISYNIFKDHTSFKRKEFLFLGVFLSFNFIALVYNYKTFNIFNLSEFLNLFMMIFGLMYCCQDELDRRFIVFKYYNYILFAVSTISLGLYILNVHGRYFIGGNEEFYGVYQGRLWGLVNANITSFLVTTSIVFSLILLQKNISVKFTKLNLVVQAHVFMLSQSRAMWAVAGFVTFFYFVFVVAKKYSKIKRAVMVVVLFCVIYLISEMYITYVTILPTKAISYVREKISSQKEEEEILAKRIITEGTISQGRSELWMDAKEIIEKSPILGNGLYDLKYNAKKYFGKRWHSVVKLAGIHNIYLMIWLVGGLFSLLVFLGFVIFTLYKFSEYILKVKGEEDIKLLMIFCVSLFFEELIESRMVYILHYYSFIFWLLMGYCFKKVYDYSKDRTLVENKF